MLSELMPKRVWPKLRQGGPFSELQRTADRLLGEFYEDVSPFSLVDWGERSAKFCPYIDVEESEDKYTLTAELPGMEEKDIEVDIDHNTLIIKGEKKQETVEKSANRYFCERRFGAFQRTIKLDNEIDSDKINAKYGDGVLTVTVPKTAEAKRSVKRIPVKH